MKIMIWNYFKKLKEKREQAKLQKIENEKQIILAKKAEIKTVDDRIYSIYSENHSNEHELQRKNDSVCPRCNSNNVNDLIKRLNGSLDGSIDGRTGLFGIGYTSGRIHGDIDTYPVNKCNDCHHEWQKYETCIYSTRELTVTNIQRVIWILKEYYNANNCTYDANDLNEKYNSLNEKKEELFRLADNDYAYYYKEVIKTIWKGISIEVFEFFLNEYLDKYYYDLYKKVYNEELMLNFGFKKNVI